MTLARRRSRQLAFACSFVSVARHRPRRREPDLLDGVDAGRFPQRRRRGPVDRQRRPHVPRPGRVGARRDLGAVPVVDRRRRRTARCWAGSGNEGKVLKIARDGKVTTFFDAAELEVHAIARGAARRPLRRHVARREDLFGRGRRHVEDVLRSRRQVHLGAGVRCRRQPLRGDRRQGRHLQDHARRQGRRASTRPARPTWCRSPSTKTGELIAGTESPGRVFRIDASREGVRAARFPLPRDPRAAARGRRDDLRRGRERDAVCAASDRAADVGPADAARSVVPSVSTEITGMTVVEGRHLVELRAGVRGALAAATRPRRDLPDPSDGLWDTVWETGRRRALRPDRRGGRQPAGRHRHRGQDFPAERAIRRERRCSPAPPRARSRRSSASRPAASSAPPATRARCSRCRRRRRGKGTYESDVRDAGTVASWGAIRWRASGRAGQVQIVTRSGNTATPDETWSAWSKPYTNADGEQIGSPNARYLQWRATMHQRRRADGPVLTSVTAAYLPRNLRPEVLSITVHPPGAVFQRPFSTGELEIAGFEDNTSDGRQPNQSSAPRPARRRRRRRRSAAGSIRRGCRRSSGRRRTRTTTGCSTTCSTGAKGKRPGRC